MKYRVMIEDKDEMIYSQSFDELDTRDIIRYLNGLPEPPALGRGFGSLTPILKDFDDSVRKRKGIVSPVKPKGSSTKERYLAK